jgi:hypothetical protein
MSDEQCGWLCNAGGRPAMPKQLACFCINDMTYAIGALAQAAMAFLTVAVSI